MKKLENSGFSSFVVGGAVRDMLMGREPADYDLATSATPNEILALFPGSAVDTGGRRFGTVTVFENGMSVEVTTYRSESGYSDRRRPDKVHFETDINADLSRRDFTVNAMAYHPNCGLLDPFGGAIDLKNKVLKTVGDPQVRFSEDALRVYRLFRFSARLGFSIDPLTLQRAKEAIPLLPLLPVERIAKELLLTLEQPFTFVLDLAVNQGFFAHLGFHYITKPEMVGELPKRIPLRLAAFCFLTNTRPETVSRTLKLSNELAFCSSAFYSQLIPPLPDSPSALKKRFSRLAPENWEDLLTARSLLMGEKTKACREKIKDILQKGEAWNRSMLKIGGGDLVAAGFQGREISKTLDRLLEDVIESPELNERTKLLDLALKLKGHLQ